MMISENNSRMTVISMGAIIMIAVRSTQAEPEEIVTLKLRIRECYKRGWTFHRREVESDPTLLEYVLRTNYMRENANIP